MKKIIILLLFLFTLPVMRADDFKVAQQMLDWVKVGEGDSLVSRFHPVIRPSLPASAIRGIWGKLEERAGRFVEQKSWRAEKRDTLLLEECHLVFERDTVCFSLLSDENRFVVGFHFNPVRPLPAKEESPEVEGVDYVERDTFLVNGRIKLPAVVCLPVMKGLRSPVVVFVPGSGPMDRDGTIGPNKPLRELARRLAARGVASFRYDKRTYVYGTRSAELGGVLTYDSETVDDAVSALDCVAALPQVNRGRVYVLGHNMGGMLSPRIAMLSRVPLAGMISVSGFSRGLKELIQARFRYLAKLQSVSMAEADSLSTLLYERMSAPYRSFAAEYNAVGTARGVQVPMLFIQGGHDYQVTPRDFQLWKNGLKGCPNARFIWLPNCDHLMREIPRMAVPDDYMCSGRISDEAFQVILNFLNP